MPTASDPAMRIPPWRTQSFALAAFLALACPLRAPSFLRSVLDWDESLYLLMASAWGTGHLPYTTIWDNKPPGIYAIFAAALAIFGHHIAAIRAAAIIAVTLTAFSVFRIAFALLAETPRPLAGAWAAGLAYSIGALSNDGLAANTEIFMACFTALAMAVALSPGGDARRAVLCGLLCAAAVLTKYVAIFEAPAILMALLYGKDFSWPRAMKLAAAATLGGLLPLIAIILVYAAHGRLGLWLQDSILANLRRADAPLSTATLSYIFNLQLRCWLPFYAAPLALLWPGARTPRGATSLLLIWLLGGMIGVCAAKSFYDHYFQQILPVLCVITGIGFARLARRLIAPVFAIFIAIPAFAAGNAIWHITLPLQNSRDADTPTQIARDLRAVLQPGQSVYVFDYQPVIYFLLHQDPPTRFVLPSTLTTNFLSRVAGVNAPAEVARILATRPTYIIINNFPAPASANKEQPVYDLVTSALAAFYHPWHIYDVATIYRISN